MKNSFSFLLVLISFTGFAQQPIYQAAKIDQARLYSNGAELHQKVEFNLPKGQSELVISNIANQVSENSIRLKTPSGISVLSIQYSNAYIEEYDNVEHSPLNKGIRDSILFAEKQLDELNNEINTDEQAIKLLDSNSGNTSVQFSTVVEMGKWLDYFHNKRLQLKNGLFEKKKNQQKLIKKLDDLKARLQSQAQPGDQFAQGKLIVRVLADRAGKFPFEVNYVSLRANWITSYDIEVQDVQKPVQLTYKAEVRQNTGLDWTDVQLSLTSGSINQNQRLPKWQNWFIGYQSPEVHRRNYAARPEVMMETVALSKNVSADMETSSIDDYTTVSENQLRQTYEVSLPYTILSNNKAHSVNLKKAELTADYEYYAIPKLDENAYLVASISNYADLHLLSGNANIIFDQMFVGKSFLSIENTDEDLELNLGRDAQITIDRKLISDRSGTKFLSAKKEQNFEYEITIKNNKTRAVKLKLEDQFPLSTDKSIEVSLTKTSKAKVNEETGILTWELELKPGEIQKIRFAYQIKSDKDKELSGM